MIITCLWREREIYFWQNVFKCLQLYISTLNQESTQRFQIKLLCSLAIIQSVYTHNRHIVLYICIYTYICRKNPMEFSFTLSMTKLWNKKILPHHTSFCFSELFFIDVASLNFKSSFDEKSGWSSALLLYKIYFYQVEGNIICKMINYIMITVEKYIL